MQATAILLEYLTTSSLSSANLVNARSFTNVPLVTQRSLTFGVDTIAAISKKCPDLKLDVHVVVSDPKYFIDKLATAGEAVLEAGAETATTFADTLKNAEEAIMKKMSETSAVTNRITDGVNKFNQVDNISKNLGVGSSTKNIMRAASAASVLKKGGKPSRKFRRAKRRLSRKLHFKTAH